MPSHTDDLRLAHILADDADSTTMDRYKALDLHVATKPDLTPVSESDRKVEDVMRKTLSRARPRDAFVGEEDGTTGWGVRRWVVDPIDGTKNYIRGVPVWATLISLMIEDQVVVGVVSAPALGRRWWASYGDGAWTGRALMSAQPCRVSDVRGDRGRVAVVLLAQGLGEARQEGPVGRPDGVGLADPRVRRLLVVHAGRRGRRRHRRRARAQPVRHGRAVDHRRRGRRQVHLRRRGPRPQRRQRGRHQRPAPRRGPERLA